MPEIPVAGKAETRPEESLSVVVAAYREGESLALLLPRLTRAARELVPDFEILVVDTLEPMDDSAAVCEANRVRLIRRRPTNDYGDAIRTGIAATRGEFVLIMDADGSHNPEFIGELWQHRHRAEVVIASRYTPGGRTDNPRLLVGMSRLLNQLFRLVAQFPVLDVSNSFRLYRGEPLRTLQLTFRHFDILEEILAKLLWRRPDPAHVLEIPYHFERRIAGESKRSLLVFGLHFLAAGFRLYSIRRRLWEGDQRGRVQPIS
jgi:dolichol-phosphate mannosyltransferase